MTLQGPYHECPMKLQLTSHCLFNLVPLPNLSGQTDKHWTGMVHILEAGPQQLYVGDIKVNIGR